VQIAHDVQVACTQETEGTQHTESALWTERAQSELAWVVSALHGHRHRLQHSIPTTTEPQTSAHAVRCTHVSTSTVSIAARQAGCTYRWPSGGSRDVPWPQWLPCKRQHA
jgi:hypothetical protein